LCHSPENTCLPPYVVSNYDKGQYWPAGDIGFHRRITQPCLLIHSASRGVSLIEMLEMERVRRDFKLMPSNLHIYETNEIAI